MQEKEEKVEEKQRPVAGMKALGLGAFCAFGVFVIAIIVGMLSVNAGKKILLKHSSSAPLEIHHQGVTEGDYANVVKRIKAFVVAASKKGSKVKLAISAAELNSLIAYNPDLIKFKKFVKFTIREKRLFADMSLPLDVIPSMVESGKGRYLNGEAELRVFIKKSEGLNVQFYELFQDGVKVQADALDSMQMRNLLDFYPPKLEGLQVNFDLVREVELLEGSLLLKSFKEKVEK